MVLLIVLVMLTLAVVATTTMASRSLSLADQALVAERELQHRWAISSLRNSVSLRVKEVMEKNSTEAETAGSTSMRQFTVQLGTQSYLIRIDNEEAKINLLTLQKHANGRATRSLVLKASSGTRLQPGLLPSSQDSPLTTWTQIFPNASSQQSELFTACQEMTLWGNGRLNINEADLETVQLFIESVTNRNVANRIVARVSRGRVNRIEEVTRGFGERHRRKLAQLLSVNSETYTVWIQPEDRRLPPEVHVSRSTNNQQRIHSLVW